MFFRTLFWGVVPLYRVQGDSLRVLGERLLLDRTLFIELNVDSVQQLNNTQDTGAR